jgi:hypothetical protein
LFTRNQKKEEEKKQCIHIFEMNKIFPLKKKVANSQDPKTWTCSCGQSQEAKQRSVGRDQAPLRLPMQRTWLIQTNHRTTGLRHE